MKISGIILLIAGLMLGLYALTMEVGVDIPAKDYGYGVSTPATKVANLSLMNERQNLLIFSGVISIVGSILLGFGFSNTKVNTQNDVKEIGEEPVSKPKIVRSYVPVSTVTICPHCRKMETGEVSECSGCGAVFS
ncbi:MAG: hypothetical protein Q7T66_04895 [Herminiimonas sp.]|uniref:hypothetical protein n=1 Tax=Herminiimonas sp. TaxID=1926289 RepID=UPI00271CF414|nr:hypothetical protein [Herminiimonas sp.]MDO9419983.1 hypothetical protein [Herminiimonas sp.]